MFTQTVILSRAGGFSAPAETSVNELIGDLMPEWKLREHLCLLWLLALNCRMNECVRVCVRDGEIKLKGRRFWVMESVRSMDKWKPQQSWSVCVCEPGTSFSHQMCERDLHRHACLSLPSGFMLLINCFYTPETVCCKMLWIFFRPPSMSD